MRIRISHLIAYGYETTATSVIQMLSPRNHDGQYVARLRQHCGLATRVGI
jgi:hypothetical protein